MLFIFETLAATKFQLALLITKRVTSLVHAIFRNELCMAIPPPFLIKLRVPEATYIDYIDLFERIHPEGSTYATE